MLGKHEELAESWETIKRTVKGTLGYDVEKNSYCLGPKLKFDPKKEKFVKNKKANKMVTRRYRKPFAVPKKV